MPQEGVTTRTISASDGHAVPIAEGAPNVYTLLKNAGLDALSQDDKNRLQQLVNTQQALKEAQPTSEATKENLQLTDKQITDIAYMQLTAPQANVLTIAENLRNTYPALFSDKSVAVEFWIWGYQFAQEKSSKEKPDPQALRVAYTKLSDPWGAINFRSHNPYGRIEEAIDSYFSDPEDFKGTPIHYELVKAAYHRTLDSQQLSDTLAMLLHHRAEDRKTKGLDREPYAYKCRLARDSQPILERYVPSVAIAEAREIRMQRALKISDYRATPKKKLPKALCKIIDPLTERSWFDELPSIDRITLEALLRNKKLFVLLMHVESLGDLARLLHAYADHKPAEGKENEFIKDYYKSKDATFLAYAGSFNKPCPDENNYLLKFFPESFSNRKVFRVLGDYTSSPLTKEEAQALLEASLLFPQNEFEPKTEDDFRNLAAALIYAKKALKDDIKEVAKQAALGKIDNAARDRVKEDTKLRMHTYLDSMPGNGFFCRGSAYADRVYYYFIGDLFHWMYNHPKKAFAWLAVYAGLVFAFEEFNLVERCFDVLGIISGGVDFPAWLALINSAVVTIGVRFLGVGLASALGLTQVAITARAAHYAVTTVATETVDRYDAQRVQDELHVLMTLPLTVVQTTADVVQTATNTAAAMLTGTTAQNQPPELPKPK